MTFPVDDLLSWYRVNRRDLPWRGAGDIYAVWVSEVMLQQTQVTTVIPYYRRFMDRFRDVRALADAAEMDLLKLWEGLGYYSRVRNLHKAAETVMSRFGGEIPRDLETFRSLPGVGPYIAAAVMSIACGIPAAAVDGNVMRVYCRFRGIDDDIRLDCVRRRVVDQVTPFIPTDAAGDFTQAFMELGALICLPKVPACSFCLLQNKCFAFNNDAVAKLPFKSPAAKVPEIRVAVAVIVAEGKFYIQKRPSSGHLGGLWEFPGGKVDENESAEQALVRECCEELGTDVVIVDNLAVVKHAYSHFKIVMSVFICSLPEGPDSVKQPEGHPFCWISIDQLEDFPFPGANHKFFPQLKGFLAEGRKGKESKNEKVKMKK